MGTALYIRDCDTGCQGQDEENGDLCGRRPAYWLTSDTLVLYFGHHYQLRGSFGESEGCGWRTNYVVRHADLDRCGSDLTNVPPLLWLLIFPILEFCLANISKVVRRNRRLHIQASTFSLRLTVPGMLGYFGSFNIPQPIFARTN